MLLCLQVRDYGISKKTLPQLSETRVHFPKFGLSLLIVIGLP